MMKIFYSGIFFVIMLTSCSLKYDEVVDVSDVVPEIYYENAELIRYENGSVTMKLKAGGIEQYKDSPQNFSKNVSFSVYDNGKPSTEGKCGFLFSDSEAGKYSLFNEIELAYYSENTRIYADILSWNEKTEQLKSAAESKVRIKKDDTEVEGTGFTASGISKTFNFSGQVSGDIQTK